MRYPAWLLLFAGVLSAPQLALSAGAWGENPQYRGWQTANTQPPAGPAQYRPAPATLAPRFADQGARLRAAGYRFRPWEAAVESQRPLQQAYPQQAPVARYPAHQPAWRPTAPSTTARAPQWHAQAPVSYPVERMVQAPGPYAHTGYRFRPYQQPAKPQTAPRYRPVQVQIPDRYVFRPLNPVASPAPQRPSAIPAPVTAPYSAPATGYLPGHAAYYPPRQRSVSPYQAYRYAPSHRSGWVAGYPQPRRMAAYPTYPSFPVAYAPGFSPMPQFRPRPGPEMARPAQSSRPFSARRHFHQQRYVPGPAYAWRQGAPRYARYQAPYAYGPQSAYAPPVRSNRYGMNWYDGRGDGEGAWYSLTLKSEPVISQSQEPWAVSPYDQAN